MIANPSNSSARCPGQGLPEAGSEWEGATEGNVGAAQAAIAAFQRLADQRSVEETQDAYMHLVASRGFAKNHRTQALMRAGKPERSGSRAVRGEELVPESSIFSEVSEPSSWRWMESLCRLF